MVHHTGAYIPIPGIPYFASTELRLGIGAYKSWYTKSILILGVPIQYQHGTNMRFSTKMVNLR